MSSLQNLHFGKQVAQMLCVVATPTSGGHVLRVAGNFEGRFPQDLINGRSPQRTQRLQINSNACCDKGMVQTVRNEQFLRKTPEVVHGILKAAVAFVGAVA